MLAFRNVAAALVFGMMALSSSATSARMTAQENLVGYWKAVELVGTPVPTLPADRQPHLVFDAGGRFSGSDGCNRVTGAYMTKGEAVTFSQVANTQMACIDTGDVEKRFHGALKGTGHWRIEDGRLKFFGATGKPLAVFERGTGAASESPSPLQGTTWQMVKFEGADGKTLTPNDPAKYTIEFASDGQLSAQVDCNRGRGTWKTAGAGQIELGPLALTRAMCPEGSLHDQFVKHWTLVRSFAIKDGHLFLSLMANGGTFEFAPVPPKNL